MRSIVATVTHFQCVPEECVNDDDLRAWEEAVAAADAMFSDMVTVGDITLTCGEFFFLLLSLVYFFLYDNQKKKKNLIVLYFSASLSKKKKRHSSPMHQKMIHRLNVYLFALHVCVCVYVCVCVLKNLKKACTRK